MRRLFASIKNGSRSGKKSTYGVKLWPDWTDKTYAYCHYGTYGPYLQDLLASIDEPFCFVDVGANQGLFSLIAAQNPNCQRVVAVEPVARTFNKLQKNLELNQVGDRAVALNVGLSEQTGTSQITTIDAHSGMATLEPHIHDMGKTTTVEKIELISIIELDQHLPANLPIFVKIDVEGHEQTIVEQIVRSKHAPNLIGIFYENDDRWSDGSAIDAALASGGFARLYKYGRGSHYDVFATPMND